MIVGFLLPPLFRVRAGTDGQTLGELLNLLGVAFLVLGGATLLMVVLAREVERAAPQNAAAWEWWMEFVVGVLGATMFGLPASLVLPVMAFLYTDRPNWAFPAADASFWPAGYLGILFTVCGLITLAGLWHLGRVSYRNRPRWRR